MANSDKFAYIEHDYLNLLRVTMSDFKEILSQAKRQIKEVSVQEVNEKLNPANGFTLLDVREGDEWEQGHLNQAIFIPRGFLEIKADKKLKDKSTTDCRLLCRRDPFRISGQDPSRSRLQRRLFHARRLQ